MLLACRRVKLLRLALGLCTSSGTLGRLNPELVGRVRGQVLDPHAMVVVPVRLLCSAPRGLGGLVQGSWAGSILHDAAACSIGGPSNLCHSIGGFLHYWTVSYAFGLRFVLRPSRDQGQQHSKKCYSNLSHCRLPPDRLDHVPWVAQGIPRRRSRSGYLTGLKMPCAGAGMDDHPFRTPGYLGLPNKPFHGTLVASGTARSQSGSRSS